METNVRCCLKSKKSSKNVEETENVPLQIICSLSVIHTDLPTVNWITMWIKKCIFHKDISPRNPSLSFSCLTTRRANTPRQWRCHRGNQSLFPRVSSCVAGSLVVQPPASQRNTGRDRSFPRFRSDAGSISLNTLCQTLRTFPWQHNPGDEQGVHFLHF